MSDNQQQRNLLEALHEQRHHQRNPLDLSDAVRARRAHLQQVKMLISESHVEAILACISC